ncbi:hypothetical protein FNV43_RR12464 [Rhamnella rubrinervis]|uniref:Uncharacterized protein n=1 Tax=Rhamnella rubrinervis TaxID=2594499 RepID=A0A8K0H7I7_9ROSA|nr:hypothetical protein FNV43_RR12464 [Rhamnella rubrinervis]
MEESEANSMITGEGNSNGLQEYPIQARLEETNQLIKKLSEEKLDTAEKSERDYIGNRLEILMKYREVEMRDRIGQVIKTLDILEVRADKLNFANNAYQQKPINASFSKPEIDYHKVHYRMIHGTHSIAKEKQLLREIKASQNAPDHDTSLSMQQLNYPTCWWHRSLGYETDPKKAKDGLTEVKQHELERDTTIANATVKGRIWNSMGSKSALQHQIKALRIELDELRKKLLEIRSNITRLKNQLRAADKGIDCFKKQYEVIDGKKVKAHLQLHALIEGTTK